MPDIKNTGTGRGFHQALSFHGCVRRAKYEHSVPRSVATTPSYLLVGTIGHELLRQWRLGNDIPPGEPWTIDGEPVSAETINEAYRVFQAYKMSFGRRDFGDVIATEMRFPVDPDHAAKIAAVLGSVRSGAADLVVDVNRDDIARLAKTGIVVPRPGILIVDDKFEKDGGEFTLLKHRHSFQFQTYMVMYALATGVEPVGAVVNVLVKNKTPKFVRVFVPPPTEDTILALRAFYAHADAAEQTEAFDSAKCLENYRVCPLLESGSCQRH